MKIIKILIIAVALILISALMLTGCKWGDKTPPDYPDPPVESNAETFVETDAPKLEKKDGGGVAGLTYKTDVYVYISSGTASLYFANPNISVDNVLVKIYADGFRIAETGILEPGTKITTLPLNDVGIRTIKTAGDFEGKFVVEFYDSETNEKSVLNTEIPITVKVR
ncbi:MAG: hypothetical protein IKB02_01425 [Clostridia bacterium]|nr:hypothetical protein [Clostridia bacterium]